LEEPFTLPEEASADALALLPTPPREEAVRFLPPQKGSAVGTLQLQLQAPKEAAEVRFFVNGEAYLTKKRPPWELLLSLGPVPKRTVVRAEAWDAAGRFLGEDALVLNQGENSLAVQILLSHTQEGKTSVTVAVSPPGAEEEVVLKLDDRPLARWLSCPCVFSLGDQELAQGKVLVAEARGGGQQGEATWVLGGAPFQEAVRVDVVEVPVVVLDAQGKPVTDLSAQDFQVLEDGQPVAVETLARSEDQPLSLGLAVDVSGSMQKDFPLVRQATGGFLSKFLRPGDRYFLATFSWDFSLLVPWASDPRLGLERLSGVRVEGGTSLHDAVIKALELLAGRKGPKGLVLLTDGEDTTSRTGWDAALRVAKTRRTPIFPVGIGLSFLDFLLRGKLTELASSTGGEAFFLSSPEDLPQLYEKIGQQLRSYYVLTYHSPSQKPLDQFRSVSVSVKGRSLQVRTIAGYFPVP
jgi:VWFA-related protein